MEPTTATINADENQPESFDLNKTTFAKKSRKNRDTIMTRDAVRTGAQWVSFLNP
jgi:hypothetical protein